MKRTYCHKEKQRARFWIRTPKALWDCLPKVIKRELPQADTTDIGSRCQACGQRLRALFERAEQGMVARTALRELVNEICNEELYRYTPPAEIVNLRQPIPTQTDLLQTFLAQVLKSLNIDLNLPPVSKPQQEPLKTAVVSQAPVHTLRKTCELYFKEKGSNVGVNPKTEKDRRNSLSLLMEYLGEDFDIGKITRGMMVDIRMNLLQKYPLHRKKLYPNLPLKEVLRLKTVKAYISESTQSRYMEFWSGFFNWAVQADYITKNPATGLYDRSEFYDVRELRPPFTTRELTAIFTMIADLPNRPRFMTKLYPMRYWVNLLALYQGMRLNEICQLYLDDIVMEEGLPCIRIRPDRERQQKVKNKSSIRTIPIHSTILRLGFLGDGGMFPLYALDKLAVFPGTPVILTDILEIASEFNHASEDLIVTGFYGGTDAIPATDIRPLFGADRRTYWLLLNRPGCTDSAATYRAGLKMLEKFRSYDRNLYFVEPLDNCWKPRKVAGLEPVFSRKSGIRELSFNQFMQRCCKLKLRMPVIFDVDEPEISF